MAEPILSYMKIRRYQWKQTKKQEKKEISKKNKIGAEIKQKKSLLMTMRRGGWRNTKKGDGKRQVCATPMVKRKKPDDGEEAKRSGAKNEEIRLRCGKRETHSEAEGRKYCIYVGPGVARVHAQATRAQSSTRPRGVGYHCRSFAWMIKKKKKQNKTKKKWLTNIIYLGEWKEKESEKTHTQTKRKKEKKRLDVRVRRPPAPMHRSRRAPLSLI